VYPTLSRGLAAAALLVGATAPLAAAEPAVQVGPRPLDADALLALAR